MSLTGTQTVIPPERRRNDGFIILMLAVLALIIFFTIVLWPKSQPVAGSHQLLVAQKGEYLYQMGWEQGVSPTAMYLENVTLRQVAYPGSCPRRIPRYHHYFCNSRWELAAANTILPGQQVNVPHVGQLTESRLAALASKGPKAVALVVDLSDRTNGAGPNAALYAAALQPGSSQKNPSGYARADGLWLNATWLWDGTTLRLWSPTGSKFSVPVSNFTDAVNVAFSLGSSGQNYVVVARHFDGARKRRFDGMHLGILQCTSGKGASCVDLDDVAKETGAQNIPGA